MVKYYLTEGNAFWYYMYMKLTTEQYNVWDLLEITESAGISSTPSGNYIKKYRTVEYPARDGWTVVVAYGDGEVKYIDSFINPEGEVVDFWKWPMLLDDNGYEASDQYILMGWRQNGDMERLRARSVGRTDTRWR